MHRTRLSRCRTRWSACRPSWPPWWGRGAAWRGRWPMPPRRSPRATTTSRPHRAAGCLAGGDGLQHGGAGLHRAPQLGQRPAGQPDRPAGLRRGSRWQRGAEPGSGLHARHPRGLAQDRGHHQRDRLHRRPDQHPRPERRGGGAPRRRAVPRLRGGGRRGAQPGPAQRRGRPRDQGPHRRQHGSVEKDTSLVDQTGGTMGEGVGAI
jgi:hypothetical protein